MCLLPRLASDHGLLEQLCKQHGLQHCTPADDEHSDLILVKNTRTFGLSEVAVVDSVIHGVHALVLKERDLQQKFDKHAPAPELVAEEQAETPKPAAEEEPAAAELAAPEEEAPKEEPAAPEEEAPKEEPAAAAEEEAPKEEPAAAAPKEEPAAPEEKVPKDEPASMPPK